ncbi:kinase-like protein [Serendipita vermifera]|nr:kinase-like protein [Serendipita vermifera]
MDFDVIPFEDIKGDWKKLGSGSFGNVYKGQSRPPATLLEGNYLGIDVAIKEVLPSTEYDVAKYFEREWRLMKEARHPNVVLYLGLSRAPAPSNRIFIISEFIPNGNLRTYIYNKTLPFPWRLRLSFSIDIARALAYLHARQCIHRDLKGENLLITSNGRLKITDFGFARIAARNMEESKRLTFCGTDSYMSPEILIGLEFGLPTDVYSLGIIFCEIIARKLADDHTFKRAPPHYEIDEAEIRVLASPGAPEDFIKLALECCATNPAKRPTMIQVLDRLRAIELEVLNRKPEEETYHVGSIKMFTGVGTTRGKNRPGMGPRIPSFGMGVGDEIRGKKEGEKKRQPEGPPVAHDGEAEGDSSPEETSEDEELLEAIEAHKMAPTIPSEDDVSASEITIKQAGNKDTKKLEDANDSLPLHHEHIKAHHNRAAVTTESTLSQEPLLKESSGSLVYTDYSTSVVRKAGGAPPSLSSILTVRPNNPTPNVASGAGHEQADQQKPISQSDIKSLTTDSRVSIQSYHTANDASSSFITNPYASHVNKPQYSTSTIGTLGAASIAAATEGGSTVRSEIIGGLHRFTLIKPGSTSSKSAFPGNNKSNGKMHVSGRPSFSSGSGWSPLDFFFSSGFGFGGSGGKVAKCDLCGKRLGWKPCLECDDCGLRTHLKCGEMAPRDCGLRGTTTGTKGVGLQIMESSPPAGKAKSNTRK